MGVQLQKWKNDSCKSDLSDHQIFDVNVIKVLFYNLCQLVLNKDREVWGFTNPLSLI